MGDKLKRLIPILLILTVVIILIFLFKNVLLQLLGVLLVVALLCVGAYYLFMFAFGCLGLILIVGGAIASLAIIIGLFTYIW